MKSILQSIKPQYCELIASGKKTVEVRKTRPKLDVPFKAYIYCTKDKLLTKSHNNGNIYLSENKYKSALEKAGNVTLSGKVIGEYVCDEITEYTYFEYASHLISEDELFSTGITFNELLKYGNKKPLYLWHISDLVIYDKPKELSVSVKYGFEQDYAEWEHYSIAGVNGKEPDIDDYRLISSPQSWCYVEEV